MSSFVKNVAMSQIQLEYFPFRLNFKYPFRLSHTERTGTDNVYVLLKLNGEIGWGECVFIPYYAETIETFKQLITQIQLPENLNEIDRFISTLRSTHSNKNFCIAAIDIALHNLRSKITQQSITDFYKINAEPKETSFTLGISDDNEMEIKIADNPGMSYYKLKVNQAEVNRIIETFERFSNKPFTIDANQGFTDRNEALKLSYQLADKGVWYMEQPFHKDDLESHAWLKARSPIPIIADESFQSYEDLEKIVKYFDGVNVKVMKCGGISEGVRCLNRSHEMELKTIIGCMSESSVAIDASLQIAPLSDWIDLDGNQLITNDLFGKNYQGLEKTISILKQK